jgi:hypothetical protein
VGLAVRYTLYEHPVTRRFAFIPLPAGFIEGDKLPIVATEQWFGTHAEAIAAVPELLNREERSPGAERLSVGAE